MLTRIALAAAIALIPATLIAQHDSAMMAEHHHTMSDTSFAAMQARGAMVMGMDQKTSTHTFDALPDGGRITLESDSGTPADVAAIRAHLRSVAVAFAAGDFSAPFATHQKTVPGVAVLSARRAHITYSVADTPRGATLRLVTKDRAALQAISEFMAFQRDEHHAAGTP